MFDRIAGRFHVQGVDQTQAEPGVHVQATRLIHDRAERFGLHMPASRILVNSPAAQGICGVTTRLLPSYTLGCGTFGGNSTTDNVSYQHLQNLKRLAFLVDPQPGGAGADLRDARL